MSKKKILKILVFSLIILVFVLSFGLMSSCRTDEPAETADGSNMQDEENTDDAEDMEAPEEVSEDNAAYGYMDISAAEAKELIENNPGLIIIDVSPRFDEGHIPGAVNYYIGDGSLDAAIPGLDPEAMYLVYCHVDPASIGGARKLVDAGFKNVYRLEGNYAAWVEAGYEIEKGTGGVQAMLKITSPAFENNGDIPPKYTCDGDNVNPELIFEGVPSGAESLVLIVDDPDAPGGTWVHWTVWNIDPSVDSIGEDSVPEGAVEGNTDFGKPGYGGPCPPSGKHRYFFKLYALDTDLDLDIASEASDIEAAMEGHILASAELIGLYSRQ